MLKQADYIFGFIDKAASGRCRRLLAKYQERLYNINDIYAFFDQ
jgi:hypothetical protein